MNMTLVTELRRFCGHHSISVDGCVHCEAADAIADYITRHPEGVSEDFTAWLEREMPEGTVIGNPKWWADRIARQLPKHNRPAQGGNWTEVDAVADEMGRDGGWLHDKWAHRLTQAMPKNRPAQEKAEPVAGDFHAMNGSLCDFAMRWEMDGDYLRCRKCNRPQITNYAHVDFVHASECKAAGKVEPRPWETLIALLAPLYTAPPAERVWGPDVREVARTALAAALCKRFGMNPKAAECRPSELYRDGDRELECLVEAMLSAAPEADHD